MRRRNFSGQLVAAIAVIALACLTASVAADPGDAARAEHFELKVRPLLVRHCQKCHGPDKQKGGLRLDSRAAVLTGGDSGPAVVPGKPQASLLLAAVGYQGLEMPPSGKLAARDIQILTRWIAGGAVWPGPPPAGSLRAATDAFTITDSDRRYWAFQPLKQPDMPDVAGGSDDHPIDLFLAVRRREQGIAVNPPADRRTLLRRLYFDLIGLPPSVSEVEAFLQDDRPDAWSRRVDRLLASPRFGERWGRHWLDVVRFGQTNGYERDDEKPEAWRYRDYVIRSFNVDKPFRRFVLEQLAGDELDDITLDSIVATGYYRVGVWDDEPAEKVLARLDEKDDLVRVTGAAFLGLTIGCARCHHHMFDPISQGDYYRFLACFQTVAPYGRDKGGNSETHWEANPDAIYTPLVSPQGLAEWEQQRQQRERELAALRQQLAARPKTGDSKTGDSKTGDSANHRQQLGERIKQLEQLNKQKPFGRALSVRESGTPPGPTHVLIRGEPGNRGRQVKPAALEVLGGAPLVSRLPTNTAQLRLLHARGVKPTSGRRRALADWIASDNNPLTARVLANRVWQHLMGRGIVKTPNNFGTAGTPPTHPVLLDWLAARLIRNGWQVKPLIREIVNSQAYQLSSRSHRPAAVRRDPGNDHYWRHQLRRMDAEALRDSMLAVGGNLNLEMGGRGFFPQLSADVLATQSRPGHNWGKSDAGQRHRRSVYMFVKRTLMVPMLEAFDYTNTAEPLGVRPVTTVAPQALMLLNDPFVEQQAAALAERVARQVGNDPQEQVRHVFRVALARDPTPRETEVADRLLNGSRGRAAGLKSLCLVVLNLNEFVYLD